MRTDSNDRTSPGEGPRDLKQFVDKAMRDLDETKRAIAEEAMPSPFAAFAKRAATVVLIVLSAAAWLFAIVYWVRSTESRMDMPHEVAARDTVAAIVAAEAKFLDGAYFDANGDGLPEYGKLHQIIDPGGAGAGPALIDTALASCEAHGYVFSVIVIDSSLGQSSRFKVVASPLDTTGSARVVLADESGVVRTLEKDALRKAHEVVVE